MTAINFIFIFVYGIVGYVAAALYEHIAKKMGVIFLDKKSLIIYGFRLHHSLYGLLGLIISIVFFVSGMFKAAQVLLGISIGILLQHFVTDGFKFITKEK